MRCCWRRSSGWTPRAIQQLEEATYLHDIGKIAVSDRVLLKSGTLTDEEWALMKQHPTVSAEIIEALLDHEFVAGVRHHHERWDGGGYPDGLAGEEIPLIARLLCLVDSYDAMSSRRVYRPALTRRSVSPSSGTAAGPSSTRSWSTRSSACSPGWRTARRAAGRGRGGRRPDRRGRPRQVAPARRRRVAAYARILRTLRGTRLEHREVQSLMTEVPVDDLRCMIVVDDDDDDASAVPPGEVVFCDDLELETFAGRRNDANVVSVDRWGTWIGAAAPIRDDEGGIVGLVIAS